MHATGSSRAREDNAENLIFVARFQQRSYTTPSKNNAGAFAAMKPTGDNTMERRSFVKKAAAGASVGAAAVAPTLAQTADLPTIGWRLASSFPKNLDTIFGASDLFTKRVAQLTDGKFTIRAFSTGKIVPVLEVMDALRADTVEMGHTAAYYIITRRPPISANKGKQKNKANEENKPFSVIQ